MKKKFISTSIFIFIIVFGQRGFAISSEPKTSEDNNEKLTKEDRIWGLVTIYSTAKQRFPYFEKLPNLDWDKAFKEYIPLVEKEQSLLDYYKTLRRFTSLLQDGHTYVFFPEKLSKQMDMLPLKVEYIQNKWIITERMPTEEILQEDIPIGSVVLKIEGVDANEYIEKEFLPYVMQGSIQGRRAAVNWDVDSFFREGQKIIMVFQYPDGSVHTRTISADRKQINWNDNLYKKYSPSRLELDFNVRQLQDNILYVRYYTCYNETQKKFCKLIEEMNEPPKSIIIDLRGNLGGDTPELAISHLISSPIPYFQFKTKWSISFIDVQTDWETDANAKKAEFEKNKKHLGLPDKVKQNWFEVTDEKTRILPAEKNYKGKLVLLIDHESMSGAENFAVLLQASGRAKVIGESSFGSTGPPLVVNLPGGGKARICTAYCAYPDGKEFVGVGIQPDIPVERTIKGITEGHDEILEAAINYLKN